MLGIHCSNFSADMMAEVIYMIWPLMMRTQGKDRRTSCPRRRKRWKRCVMKKDILNFTQI